MRGRARKTPLNPGREASHMEAQGEGSMQRTWGPNTFGGGDGKKPRQLYIKEQRGKW